MRTKYNIHMIKGMHQGQFRKQIVVAYDNAKADVPNIENLQFLSGSEMTVFISRKVDFSLQSQIHTIVCNYLAVIDNMVRKFCNANTDA